MSDTRPTALREADQRPVRVLLVEDEALFAKAVTKRLRKAGFECEAAGSLAAARQRLRDERPDLILLDMRLPDGSGLDLLAELRGDATAEIAVVVLTAHGELDDAVAAMKLDAADYLKKPIDLDELLLALRKVLDNAEVGRRLAYSRERESRAVEEERMLGESPVMRRVRREIERLAVLAGRAEHGAPTVLITGETGTGKDVAARLLHRGSARRDRPFVHVDCAALPGELIESELFGHEKGAFTSAHAARTGLIEAAEDGTVYLDEVAEIAPELQAKLLAVLERRTLRRVGSSRERDTRAWFIAGTNRSLDERVASGRFRADLLYRLKVLTVAMPPLRERGEDVALLARHFAARTARRFGLPEPVFERGAEEAMRAYPWPGNVRELAHLVERAVLLSAGEPIGPLELMLDCEREPGGEAEAQALEGMTLEQAERLLITRALERTAGNVSEAARQLGVTRMALRYRMQQHGITRPA